MGSGNSTNKTDGKLIDVMDAGSGIICSYISSDKSIILVGLDDGDIHMYTTRTDEIEDIGICKGHTSYVTCLTSNEHFIISGSNDKTIRRWSMETCECVQVYPGHTSRISKLITNGEILISTSYDKTIKLWNYDDDDEDDMVNYGDKSIRTFKGHTGGVYSVIYIPELEGNGESPLTSNDMIITASVDGTARIWIFSSEDALKVLKGHAGTIIHLAIDNTGKYLFTASSDKTIRSWNVDTGKCLKVLVGHEEPVMRLIVQDRLLYSASADGTVKCWVHEFGDLVRTYRGHKHTVNCVKFHNGLIYTGSSDTFIRAFDAKTGYVKATYKGHKNDISDIIIVGEKLFSTSSDGTIHVWDISDTKANQDLNPENDDEDE